VFVSGEAAIFRVETPCHAMVADAPSTR
jgi:hypothetical protein